MNPLGKRENRKTGELENGKTVQQKNWETGKLENEKTGKLENRKTGELEKKKTGKWENWKTGKLANWQEGELANWLCVCVLDGSMGSGGWHQPWPHQELWFEVSCLALGCESQESSLLLPVTVTPGAAAQCHHPGQPPDCETEPGR